MTTNADLMVEITDHTDDISGGAFDAGYNSLVMAIVRCKDCKIGRHKTNYRGEEVIRCFGGGYDSEMMDDGDVEPDHFCGYGEGKS